MLLTAFLKVLIRLLRFIIRSESAILLKETPVTNLRPVGTLEESAVLLMTTLGRFMLDLSKLTIRKIKIDIPESL